MLDHLPVELLLHILKYAGPKPQLHLSRTCKILHALLSSSITLMLDATKYEVLPEGFEAKAHQVQYLVAGWPLPTLRPEQILYTSNGPYDLDDDLVDDQPDVEESDEDRESDSDFESDEISELDLDSGGDEDKGLQLPDTRIILEAVHTLLQR